MESAPVTMRPLYLRPWHAFLREGQEYVVNPARMISRRVPAGFTATLQRLDGDSTAPRTREDEQELFRLELVSSQPVTGAAVKHLAEEGSVAPPIRSINLLIAQRCNLRCTYCYGGGGEYGEAGMMSEETALRAVDWLLEQSGDNELVSVSFFGGEPLLALPLLKKVTAHLRETAAAAGKRANFAVATNGVLLDDEALAWFKENGFRLLVGFDGPPEIQDRNRPLRDGSPSSAAFLESARRITEVMPEEANFRATVLKSEELPAVVEHMADVSPGAYQTAFAAGCVSDDEAGEALPSPADAIPYMEECVAAFLAAVQRGDEDEVRRWARWLDFGRALDMLRPQRPRGGHCGVGRVMAAVASDGTIYACHRFVGSPEHRIGDVWHGLGDRSVFVDKPTFRQEPCRSCWAGNWCIGGCLQYNYTRTGDMFLPPEDNCLWTKAWIEAGIHLAHELTDEDRAKLAEMQLVGERSCPWDL